MRDQGAPEALPLMIRVDVELVDEISRYGQKSRDTPVELRHPDIMAGEHDVAEVLAILLRRVALPCLEVRKGPEARAPPEIVHRVEVRGLVSTNCGLAGHSGNLHRVRTGALHDFCLSARLAHGHRIIAGAHGSISGWEGTAMPVTWCSSRLRLRAPYQIDQLRSAADTGSPERTFTTTYRSTRPSRSTRRRTAIARKT